MTGDDARGKGRQPMVVGKHGGKENRGQCSSPLLQGSKQSSGSGKDHAWLEGPETSRGGTGPRREDDSQAHDQEKKTSKRAGGTCTLSDPAAG